MCCRCGVTTCKAPNAQTLIYEVLRLRVWSRCVQINQCNGVCAVVFVVSFIPKHRTKALEVAALIRRVCPQPFQTSRFADQTTLTQTFTLDFETERDEQKRERVSFDEQKPQASTNTHPALVDVCEWASSCLPAFVTAFPTTSTLKSKRETAFEPVPECTFSSFLEFVERKQRKGTTYQRSVFGSRCVCCVFVCCSLPACVVCV